MQQIEQIRGAVRTAILEGKLPRTTNVDRLTATALSIGVLRRFHEGYFGPTLIENMAKAAQIRQTEGQDAYDRALMNNAVHISDLKAIAPELRQLEALTNTDFALGLALTRANAAALRDFRPAFKTDLLDPNFTTRRTVDNLTPIASRNGVQLADKFLRRRAEASNVAYTSFSMTGGAYTVDNWELGLNFTEDMKSRDEYGQLQDAAFRMGESAARTRALTVLDAAIRKAPRLVLPNAAFGPDIDNLNAVLALMGDQTINGVPASQTVSDIFVSGAWAATARTALSTPTLVNNVGGLIMRPNPVLNMAEIHNEQILTLADWAQDYPGLDRKTWFAVDRDAKPFEFATKRGFENGPLTLVEVPHTVDLDLGSFDNHLFRIKVVDYIGADVANPAGVLLIPGSPTAPDAWGK